MRSAQAEAILTSLASFRSYLGYHIKCSKGYMHSRMRTRVTSLLQVRLYWSRGRICTGT